MSFDAKEISARDGAPLELWKFTQGATDWSYSSGDVAVSYDSLTYAVAYVKRSEMARDDIDNMRGMTFELARDTPVAALFQGTAPATEVWVRVFRKHRADAEVVLVFVGRCGTPVWKLDRLQLTAESLLSVLKQPLLVDRFSERCTHAFGAGDGVRGCNKDRSTLEVAATVTAVSGRLVSADEFALEADGYFQGGEAVDGTDRRMIRAHTGDTVETLFALPDVDVSDVLTCTPGCNKAESTCALFNNFAEHNGNPHQVYRDIHRTGVN